MLTFDTDEYAQMKCGHLYQMRNFTISELLLNIDDALARLKYEYTRVQGRSLSNIQNHAARIAAAVEIIERRERNANG